ncbi:mitochondrial carrier domain-containing protein [Rhodotorula diobovata]|uniref:Mitochondrial carrier domain-containing protein n=1 Tax=Rhodotorula diobovata TaxID=5288 RepID=A0A5C5FWC5_9BASI|nr:mitochondrial carrier domain-containing protein [Rhodotorula diobovata]
MSESTQAIPDPAPSDDPDHPLAAPLPPPLPDYPVPPSLPRLAEPPSNSLLFDLEASSPITLPPSKDDPRVSLRAPPPPPEPYCPSSGPALLDHDPEPATLNEFRQSEGPAKRLSRLRSLFDSLPAPSPPSSPAASSSALPPEPDQQQQQLQPSTTTAAFEQYADAKERELWRAFVDLDRDGDHRLRAPEVREACRRAGLEVKDQAIDDFVRAVDRNGDGFISFDEWRDFLLLLPRPISMKEVWRYWQARPLARPSMSRLTQDGDGEPALSLPRRCASRPLLRPAPPPRRLSRAHSASPTRPTCARASRPTPSIDEEEDDEHGPMEDMLAGAGKFLLAGGMAGAVSRTATAPFDRLKVYLITSATGPPCPDLTAAAAKAGKKPPRPGAGSLTKAIKTVYNQGGGIKAFWTGNGLNIIKIFPESAIKFLSYESAKRVFAQYWDRVPDQTLISNSSRFVAGGIGGVVSQFCTPSSSLRPTRVMSSSGGCAKGNALILQTARDMWAKGGFRFFFRGLPAGLIGVFPYSAIDMSTFEGIKLAYTKWAGEEPGIAGSLCFGAISGGVGASSVYPLNLVRTRLQAQGTPAHPQTYLGVRDAATKCYQREGWRGFYKGLTPTLVKVIPAVAISYAVYDSSKKLLFAPEQAHHDDGDSNES